MPERLKSHPQHHFFEKQWDSVSSFWITRTLKEEKLQHLSIAEVIEKIVADIERRIQKKKEDQQLVKKKKRLLDNKQAEVGAGLPSRRVLITNFVTLESYKKDAVESDAQIDDILGEVCKAINVPVRMVGHSGDGGVLVERLVDDVPLLVPNAEEGGEPERKKARTESGTVPEHAGVTSSGESNAGPTTTGDRKDDDGAAFDDRVALAVVVPNVDQAATVVAKFHGRSFCGRRLMSRFLPLEEDSTEGATS